MFSDDYRVSSRCRSKYNRSTEVPRFDMAVYESNTKYRDPNAAVSPIFSEDAFERYAAQLLKSTTPEIRIKSDENKTSEGRKEAKRRIGQFNSYTQLNGESQGAYMPELLNTNVETHTYSVPNDGGYGNKTVSIRPPMHVLKSQIANRNVNFMTRLTKYTKAKLQKDDKTSALTDYEAQRKYPLLKRKAQLESIRYAPIKLDDITEVEVNNMAHDVSRSKEEIMRNNKNIIFDTDVLIEDLKINQHCGHIEKQKSGENKIKQLVSGLSNVSEEALGNAQKAKRKSVRDGKKILINSVSDNSLLNIDTEQLKNNDVIKHNPKYQEFKSAMDCDSLRKEFLINDIINTITQKKNIVKPIRTKQVSLANKTVRNQEGVSNDDEVEKDSIHFREAESKSMKGERILTQFDLNITDAEKIIKNIVPKIHKGNYLNKNTVENLDIGETVETVMEHGIRNTNGIKNLFANFNAVNGIKPLVNANITDIVNGNSKVKTKYDSDASTRNKLNTPHDSEHNISDLFTIDNKGDMANDNRRPLKINPATIVTDVEKTIMPKEYRKKRGKIRP